MFRLFERVFFAFLLLLFAVECAPGAAAGKTQRTRAPSPPRIPAASYIADRDAIIPKWTAAPEPTPAPAPVPTATPEPKNASKIIAGYYAGWAAYGGYAPDDIPADKLTHIHYAFAAIGDDLKIKMGDPYIDPKNFEKLAALKAGCPQIKTLISVGGWNGSAKFSDAALTEASRAAFADSAAEFMAKYGFDGVDIDWEYPVSGGKAGNAARSADKTNFTLLLAELRRKLDARGLLDGKRYLLSIAGGAGGAYVSNTEPDEIAAYVDYAIIMAYDIHGFWDAHTDLNAPLYEPAESSPQYKWSVDRGVKAWTRRGFPASRLVLGVPFYGYRYTGVAGGGTGLYKTFAAGSALAYDKVAADFLTDGRYKKYTHGDAKVPYLFDGSTFISYDDETSIALKAAYVADGGLAGAAVWELSQNRGGQLLDALAEGLSGAS